MHTLSLFIIIIFILFPAKASAYVKGMYRPNRCYSCMSEWYRDMFPRGLNRIFNDPKNFTDYCDEPTRPDLLELVSCRTICLMVRQEIIVMGHGTGQFVTMRGCAISLAKKGIYNHTLAMLDRFDDCKDMNAADLFRSEYGRGQNQKVRVCSCLGDRCNISLSSSSTLPLLVCIMAVLFSSIR